MNIWYDGQAKQGLADYGVYVNPRSSNFLTFRPEGDKLFIVIGPIKVIAPLVDQDKLIDSTSITEGDKYYYQSTEDSFQKYLLSKAEEVKKEEAKQAQQKAYNAMSDEDKAQHDKIDNFNKKVSELKGKTKAVIIEELARDYDYYFIKHNYPCDNSYFESIWVVLRQQGKAK